jgi:hypothetical protein
MKKMTGRRISDTCVERPVKLPDAQAPSPAKQATQWFLCWSFSESAAPAAAAKLPPLSAVAP